MTLLMVRYKGGPVAGVKRLASPPLPWPLPRNVPMVAANGFYYKIEETDGGDALFVTYQWLENPLTYGGTQDGTHEED